VRTSAGPHVLPHLPLVRGTGVALHRQLFDGLRRAIVDRLLRPGGRVPSTRALARDLGVSRLTVLTAYDQLLHEGYLEGRAGAGTFVSRALPDDALRAAPLRRARAAAAAEPTARPARTADAAPPPRRDDERGMRTFRVSLPALDLFPHATWARLVSRQARALTPAMMAYGQPAGLGVLRAAIAEHLRTSRAVRCEADQVLITSGSQAGLRLCAAVLLRYGDAVAVEEPGYPGARSAFEAGGARLAPVPVDDEGVDVAALAALGPHVRAAYVTPSHQYPLGVSMSAARRLSLLEWADRQRAWVIEDDYDSEYRYVSRPLGALQGVDPAGRVIYVGTFSKVLFPALRVGYLVVPPQLRQAFMDAREALDLFSPTLYQLALADFLREGHFVRHLRRMRTVYQGRRDALLDGLARHCADAVTVHNAEAGLHVSTWLRDAIDDVALVKRMHEHRLTAIALSTCYTGPAPRGGLLLGFGGSTERQLRAATRTLGELLDGA
jgi:GntR family transcriptional regulator / MocR family aminotransferase